MSRARSALALAVFALSAAAAPAAEIEGVRFEERRRVGETELVLHGTGLLRYRIFIKAYVAALYLGESVVPTAQTVLADVPRRLEIEYFWPLRAEQFERATLEGIRRVTDPATLERLRGRIAVLNSLYEDVVPGDRYALTYLPGVGTELERNGRSLGVVEGADFSAALFAIWLGEASIDDSLRRQLLSEGIPDLL